MNGTAIRSARLIILAGTATLLYRRSVSEIEKRLLLSLMKDASELAAGYNFRLSIKNRKKLLSQMQYWQRDLISTEPDVILLELRPVSYRNQM